MSKRAVAAFFAAGEVDDIETAASQFAEDGVWITAEGPEPGTTYSRAEIPAYLQKIIGIRKEYEAKGVEIAYGDLIEVGDRVFLEITISLASGKVVDRSIDVFTIKDGKIAVKDVYRKA